MGNSDQPISLKPLTVVIETTAEGSSVRVIGEVAVTAVDELDRQLGVLADCAGTTLAGKIVSLDLSGVSFIASLGMGVLMSFRRRVMDGGGKVKIVAANTPVLLAFQRACLIELFELSDGVRQALPKAPNQTSKPSK